MPNGLFLIADNKNRKLRIRVLETTFLVPKIKFVELEKIKNK